MSSSKVPAQRQNPYREIDEKKVHEYLLRTKLNGLTHMWPVNKPDFCAKFGEQLGDLDKMEAEKKGHLCALNRKAGRIYHLLNQHQVQPNGHQSLEQYKGKIEQIEYQVIRESLRNSRIGLGLCIALLAISVAVVAAGILMLTGPAAITAIPLMVAFTLAQAKAIITVSAIATFVCALGIASCAKAAKDTKEVYQGLPVPKPAEAPEQQGLSPSPSN